MNQIPLFSSAQASNLSAFLNAPQRPDGTMSYCECTGFLFVVACAPEQIQPSEWLPVIFDDESASYSSLEEAKEVLPSLLSLYNELNRQIQEADIQLPIGCDIRKNPLDNLEPDAPLSHWARGFIAGYDWLVELWDAYTPEDLSEELGAQMMVLSFFASRDLAQAYLEETKRKDNSLESMAAQMLDLFPDALNGFAHLGDSIQRVLREHSAELHQPARSDKIGRNERCPCGSGKKYKKCCGAAVH